MDAQLRHPFSFLQLPLYPNSSNGRDISTLPPYGLNYHGNAGEVKWIEAKGNYNYIILICTVLLFKDDKTVYLSSFFE